MQEVAAALGGGSGCHKGCSQCNGPLPHWMSPLGSQGHEDRLNGITSSFVGTTVCCGSYTLSQDGIWMHQVLDSVNAQYIRTCDG
jgi:hypothetical protein